MVDIVMKGPGKNALGTEMMRSLLEQLSAAKGAPVLLTGADDAFSAGLNLKEVAGLDEAGMAAFLERLERLMSALYLYPGPTVALVNGHAIAGGCVLTLCCDRRFVVDEPKVKIGLNEVALGLRFPPRTLSIVRRRVPVHHHEEVLLGAALFDPRGAFRVGMVDVFTRDAAAAARAELARLADLPREAYARTKHDLRGAVDADLCPDGEWQRRITEMLPVWTSPAIKSRVLAVLAR
jgi:enoyl-CoA hydratase